MMHAVSFCRERAEAPIVSWMQRRRRRRAQALRRVRHAQRGLRGQLAAADVAAAAAAGAAAGAPLGLMAHGDGVFECVREREVGRRAGALAAPEHERDVEPRGRGDR